LACFGRNGTVDALLREAPTAKLSGRISEKSCFLTGAEMDEFNDNEIAKLLRLKRYEQPPPGFFEIFLHEFHRRQRDELLRQPVWRICLERAHYSMFRLHVPSVASYPAPSAAVGVYAAAISLKINQEPETASVVL